METPQKKLLIRTWLHPDSYHHHLPLFSQNESHPQVTTTNFPKLHRRLDIISLIHHTGLWYTKNGMEYFMWLSANISPSTETPFISPRIDQTSLTSLSPLPFSEPTKIGREREHLTKLAQRPKKGFYISLSKTWGSGWWSAARGRISDLSKWRICGGQRWIRFFSSYIPFPTIFIGAS